MAVGTAVETTTAAKLFRGFADPTRLAIVLALLDGENHGFLGREVIVDRRMHEAEIRADVARRCGGVAKPRQALQRGVEEFLAAGQSTGFTCQLILQTAQLPDYKQINRS